MKMILVVETVGQSLRAEIVGWDRPENPRYVVPGPIGLTEKCDNSPTIHYDCVLRALHDGWELLGPPVPVLNQFNRTVGFTWWLTKED